MHFQLVGFGARSGQLPISPFGRAGACKVLRVYFFESYGALLRAALALKPQREAISATVPSRIRSHVTFGEEASNLVGNSSLHLATKSRLLYIGRERNALCSKLTNKVLVRMISRFGRNLSAKNYTNRRVTVRDLYEHDRCTAHALTTVQPAQFSLCATKKPALRAFFFAPIWR